MVLSLRRLITQFFGSAQVEQIDAIRRSGAERAAQQPESRRSPDKVAATEERIPLAGPARDEARRVEPR